MPSPEAVKMLEKAWHPDSQFKARHPILETYGSSALDPEHLELAAVSGTGGNVQYHQCVYSLEQM